MLQVKECCGGGHKTVWLFIDVVSGCRHIVIVYLFRSICSIKNLGSGVKSMPQNMHILGPMEIMAFTYRNKECYCGVQGVWLLGCLCSSGSNACLLQVYAYWATCSSPLVEDIGQCAQRSVVYLMPPLDTLSSPFWLPLPALLQAPIPSILDSASCGSMLQVLRSSLIGLLYRSGDLLVLEILT